MAESTAVASVGAAAATVVAAAATVIAYDDL